MSTDLVQKAVKSVERQSGLKRGAQAELARRMNVYPQYISKLLKTGVVPPKRARQIEVITNGEVTARELRPDIFGDLVA